MGRTVHHIAGGESIPDERRERVAEVLGRCLDAMAEAGDEAEMLNHTRAVELFVGVYDRVVEFSTEEMGFDIRIVGPEVPDADSNG